MAMKVNPIKDVARFTLGVLALGWLLPAHLLAAAPVVSTLTATNLTETNALLRGMVNPGGATTVAWLEWGPGYASKSSTTRTNIGNGSSPLNFSAPVSNLTAGVIYRCRAVASNSLGIVRGQTLPFGVPALTLNGSSPLTNELNAPFIDPGASATAYPTTLASGDSFALVLKADGRVTAWGYSQEGQTNVPASITNIVALAAGYIHSLAVRTDGTVTGWGTNNFDQLAIPPEATNVASLAAGYAHSLALRKDGSLVSWGSDDYLQVSLPEEATNVVAISAGYTHSLALRADGNVVEWGEYPIGPVGPPPQATNVVSIAAGYSHSLALCANGTVVAWGGEAPQVATVPAYVTNVVAIAAGYAHSLALRADGSLVGWGLNSFGEITIPADATNVVAIGAGFGYSQVLRADGTVFGWGYSDSGRTAPQSNLVVNLPVTVSGTVNPFAVGTYPLLYNATNGLGFSRNVQRLVVVPGGTLAPPNISSFTLLSNRQAQIIVDYAPSSVVTILSATNITVPRSNWTVLGAATENPPGHFVFIDAGATNDNQRFYQVRTP